jgi:hypothetical protein
MALPTILSTTTHNLPGDGTNPWSFSRTIEANCTGILVLSADGTGNANGRISGITVNSVAMTKIDDQHEGGQNIYVSIWRLDAPSTGSQTIQITWPGEVFFGTIHVMTLKDLASGTWWGTPGKAGGTSTSPAANCTLGANDIAVAAFGQLDATLSFTTGDTVQANSANVNGVSGRRLRTVTRTTDGSMSATLGASTDWAVVVVPIMGVSSNPTLLINRPRFADLSFGVHTLRRILGLNTSFTFVQSPIGTAAAAVKAVKPKFKGKNRALMAREAIRQRPEGLSSIGMVEGEPHGGAAPTSSSLVFLMILRRRMVRR